MEHELWKTERKKESERERHSGQSQTQFQELRSLRKMLLDCCINIQLVPQENLTCVYTLVRSNWTSGFLMFQLSALCTLWAEKMDRCILIRQENAIELSSFLVYCINWSGNVTGSSIKAQR